MLLVFHVSFLLWHIQAAYSFHLLPVSMFSSLQLPLHKQKQFSNCHVEIVYLCESYKVRKHKYQPHFKSKTSLSLINSRICRQVNSAACGPHRPQDHLNVAQHKNHKLKIFWEHFLSLWVNCAALSVNFVGGNIVQQCHKAEQAY